MHCVLRTFTHLHIYTFTHLHVRVCNVVPQMEKHKNVLKEIESMQQKLDTMLMNASRNKNALNEDNVEAFFSAKSSGQVVDKLEMRMCRVSTSISICTYITYYSYLRTTYVLHDRGEFACK